MKILQFILKAIISVFFTSASPNLFGSRKRQKASNKLAKEFKAQAAETQDEIDTLKSENPFESAAAKSAMATAGRNAKQIQQRYANMLGGGGTAESLVAAQGATQDAVAGTAGDIATGAEANKANEIASLRGQKSNQLSQYAQTKQSAIAEKGSGWNSFFDTLLPGVMSVAGAVGGGIAGGASGGGASGALSGIGGASGASGALSGAGGLAAAASDRNIKENIEKIGILQGRNIYKYNFIGSPSVHIGVMSQEIEKTDPDKVIMDNGILKTYYGEVFKSVK